MKASNHRGSVVLVALGVISVVSILAFLCAQNIVSRCAALRVSANWQRAVSIADAGVEAAIAGLKRDPGFEGETDTAFDGGSFSSAVSKLETVEDGWLIRSRSLFMTASQRAYRKEMLVAVRLSGGEVEILSRKENTLVH